MRPDRSIYVRWFVKVCLPVGIVVGAGYLLGKVMGWWS